MLPIPYALLQLQYVEIKYWKYRKDVRYDITAEYNKSLWLISKIEDNSRKIEIAPRTLRDAETCFTLPEEMIYRVYLSQ